MSKFQEINLDGLRKYSIKERPSKVHLTDLASVKNSSELVFPDILAAKDLRELVNHCAAAIYNGKPIFAALGGHVIKCGLAPYLIEMIKQGWLIKLKRFETAEAKVVGFELLQHNTNSPKLSETGNQVRSTESAGMVASDHLLGKFIVEGINNGFEGVQFSLGSGLDMMQRECFWENRAKLIGQIIEFKYQNFGVKTAPRTPIFLRFRDAAEF